MSQVVHESNAKGALTLPLQEDFARSTKNPQPCQRCRRTFWAWDTGRVCCYLCAPPDPLETDRILGAIYRRLS